MPFESATCRPSFIVAARILGDISCMPRVADRTAVRSVPFWLALPSRSSPLSVLRAAEFVGRDEYRAIVSAVRKRLGFGSPTEP